MSLVTAWAQSAFFVGLLYAPVTVGLGVGFRFMNFPDLTCEGSFLLGAAFSFLALKWGFAPVASLGMSVLAGAAAGACTALVHTRFSVTRLLSGIVTTAIAYSVAIRLLGGKANIRIDRPTLFDQMGAGESDAAEVGVVIITIVLLLGVVYVFLHSHLGRLLRAMGDTPWFCVSLGQNPRAHLVLGLAVANALVGFGGGLVAHYKRVCDVNMSFGVLVSGLAALVIGETIYASRSVWIHAVMGVAGTVVYNLAVGFFYFDWGTRWTTLFLPSDVRFVTGVLLVVLSLIKVRGRTYKLFNSEW